MVRDRSIPKHLTGKFVGDNRIELVSLIGHGSYGAVYLGLFHQSGSKRPKQCAVKVMCAGNTVSQRKLLSQRREVEFHQQVSHGEGIVELYETFKEAGFQFLVMKFCPDGDLWSAILTKQYLGKDKLIKDVFIQILNVIEFCHSQGVFHRDIKPENILLCEKGAKVFLADFGLATDQRTTTETFTGSPAYMSPECWGTMTTSGRPFATAPNDIWALGVLLVNLSCGKRLPWTHAHSRDHTFKIFIHNPELFRLSVPVKPEIHDILARIFVMDPKKRITIQDFKTAIYKIKSFGIPVSGMTEFYSQRNAVWNSVSSLSSPRPVLPTPRFNHRHILEEQQAVNIAPIYGKKKPPPPPATNEYRTAATTVIHSHVHQACDKRLLSPLRLARGRFSASSSFESLASETDSDVPKTPQMHTAAPEAKMIGMKSPENNPNGLISVTGGMVPSLKQDGDQHVISAGSWRSILDVMNAW